MKYSSYKKGGVLLGLVFFISVFLYKPIGISTQFSVIGGMIQNLFTTVVYEDPNNKSGYGSTFEYYNKDGGKLAKSIAKPLNYGIIFLIFTIIGGVGTTILLNKKSKQSISVKFSKKQLTIAFIAGFLLVFGARVAGGCTSGHMISGLMQGGIGSYIFTIVVFMVSIPVALLTQAREVK